ncbi:MAG: hypothetical protein NUW01_16760 [Gemmatimonadaceae bacterium]|nr:hypothetical protein [Gemmatimonadaceae bacterium]
MSRTQRWEKAVADGLDAVARLLELQEEYQEWRDNLPEADGIDLPRGFGRD